jgi:hypothetical protein
MSEIDVIFFSCAGVLSINANILPNMDTFGIDGAALTIFENFYEKRKKCPIFSSNYFIFSHLFVNMDYTASQRLGNSYF